jgi:hypothetical protein
MVLLLLMIILVSLGCSFCKIKVKLTVAYISIGGNKYGLIIVDDYSHFTWVFFL